jgi:glycosyltransferase involved in cell wall biosynthesis
MVGIGIPAYNAARYLKQSIESVRAQSYSQWRLVIVDDGSSDGTAEIARACAVEDSRICAISQPNGGAASARNTAFQELGAEYSYILFLDADDILEPDALEVLLAAIRESPEAVGAYGIASHIDAEGNRILPGACEEWCRNRMRLMDGRLEAAPLDAPTTFRELAYGECIPTPGVVLLRRDRLVAAGAWDPRLIPTEDYDMWLRLTMRGDFVFLNRVVLHYRLHNENISSNFQRMNRGYISVKRYMLASSDLSSEQRRILRESFRYSERFWTTRKLDNCRKALMERRWKDATFDAVRAARSYVASILGP